MRRLFGNFCHYFADNVVAMMFAASAGLVGNAILDKDDFNLAMVYHFCSMLVNCGVLVVVRLSLIAIITHSAEGGGVNVSLRRLLGLMPWFLRISWLSITSGICNDIKKDLNYPADSAGEAFMYIFMVGVAFLVATVLLCKAATHCDPEATVQSCQGWVAFVLETGFASFAACTGKLLHEAMHILVEGLASGDTDLDEILNYEVAYVVIVTGFACWQLLFSHPLQKESQKPHHKIRKVGCDVSEYIIVYLWSYSFVNGCWWICYNYIGSKTTPNTGLLIFTGIDVAVLLFVLIQAVFSPGAPTYDVYAPTYFRGPEVTMMIFWLVDNLTWWAWGTAMTIIDSDMHGGHPGGQPLDRSPKIVAINLAVVFGLVGVTIAFHVGGDRLIGDLGAALENPQKKSKSVKQTDETTAAKDETTAAKDETTAETNVANVSISNGQPAYEV